MKGFCLINGSTNPAITSDMIARHAAAFAAQQDELDDWYQGTKWEVAIAASEEAAPQDGEWILARYKDTLTDPDALADHSTTASGRPVIEIGVGIVLANALAGSDWVSGPDGLSVATSHELCETRANPYVALYVPWDGASWIPQEICDPVQGDSYAAKNGVSLSNFVGPRYWSQGIGPYDRMGLVTKALEIRPGGYVQKLTGGPSGTSSAIFGAEPHAGGMAEWKRIAKAKPGTRFSAIAASATGLAGQLSDRELAQADVITAQVELLEALRADNARLRARPTMIRRGNGGQGG